MIGLTPARREVAAYLVFGALTTAVNIAVYAALTRGAGLDYLWSNVVAWLVAVAFAFVTNKLWVFESRSKAPRVLAYEAGTFLSTRLLSGVLDMGMMFALVTAAHAPDLPSKVLVNVVVVVLNYLFSKRIVFRRRASQIEGEDS
jgi:putative flippase GtrA